MDWFFINWQYVLHLYIIGAIIVGSINAVIYFIGLARPRPRQSGLNAIEMLLYYVNFVLGYLVWPAVVIRLIGTVISGILDWIIRKRSPRTYRF